MDPFCRKSEGTRRARSNQNLQSARGSKKRPLVQKALDEDKEGSKCKQGILRGMKCLYSNADQLLNKMEDLKMVIASENPDIMMFTEVK